VLLEVQGVLISFADNENANEKSYGSVLLSPVIAVWDVVESTLLFSHHITNYN
jgi:hypothetical protein